MHKATQRLDYRKRSGTFSSSPASFSAQSRPRMIASKLLTARCMARGGRSPVFGAVIHVIHLWVKHCKDDPEPFVLRTGPRRIIEKRAAWKVARPGNRSATSH